MTSSPTPESRHRARDRRSPAKHAAILEAASKIFLAEGYTRASVDAIAEAAGVGKQTVYGHFGDKERLFLAAVEHTKAAHGLSPDDLAAVITDTGDPRADLTAAAERLARAVTTPEVAALNRVTIAELTHHPELRRSWRDGAGSQIVIDAVAAYLVACDDRGTLAVPDPATAARQFVLLTSAEAHARSMRGLDSVDVGDINTIAKETADLIVRAHQRGS